MFDVSVDLKTKDVLFLWMKVHQTVLLLHRSKQEPASHFLIFLNFLDVRMEILHVHHVMQHCRCCCDDVSFSPNSDTYIYSRLRSTVAKILGLLSPYI